MTRATLAVLAACACTPDSRHLGDLPSTCEDATVGVRDACFDAAARELPIAFVPLHVMPGDFDGDGFGDVLATGATPTVVTERWRGSDRGPVAPSEDPGLTGCSAYPIAGRIGGDEIDDVIFSTCEESLDLYAGTPDVFAEPVRLELPVQARSSAIVDLDGVAPADLVVLGTLPTGEAAIVTVIAEGDAFAAPVVAVLPPLGFSPTGLHAGDLDDDGRVDVVLRDPTVAGALALALGDGPGTFAAPDPLGIPGVPSAIALLAPSASAGPGIAAADRDAGRVCVLLDLMGDPACVELEDVRPVHLATADLDGDDAPEIAIADADTPALVVLGIDEDGRPDALGSIPMPAGSDLVHLVDLDGDDVLDILAAHFAARTFSIRLGIP